MGRKSSSLSPQQCRPWNFLCLPPRVGPDHNGNNDRARATTRAFLTITDGCDNTSTTRKSIRGNQAVSRFGRCRAGRLAAPLRLLPRALAGCLSAPLPIAICLSAPSAAGEGLFCTEAVWHGRPARADDGAGVPLWGTAARGYAAAGLSLSRNAGDGDLRRSNVL